MSLQDKQQFLSKEIIEQGYDAGEFSNFISSIRGEEEVDLDSWTLDELKTVCEQFKTQYGQNQENQENQENQNQENQEYPEITHLRNKLKLRKLNNNKYQNKSLQLKMIFLMNF